jgi:hypothetical protein
MTGGVLTASHMLEIVYNSDESVIVAVTVLAVVIMKLTT